MKFLSLALLMFSSYCSYSQIEQETPAPQYIRSIVFTGDSGIAGNPVIQLGGYLSLKFDDIIADEADYYYVIEHYNFDWTPSQLTKAEYLDGIDNIRIFNYTNSQNTLQPFSHYQLSIPNSNTGNLKVSGNYMLKIYNSAEELVFSRKFMVFEPLAQVLVTVKRSRDLRFVNSKQVVNFSVGSENMLLRNPDQTVKVLILQNHNLKSAITGLTPQYTIANELIYRYDQQSAFWAGNEYLKFDSKDLRSPSAFISRIELRDLYHHFLFTDRSRDTEPYTYNPDINGQFLIQSFRAENKDLEAEYIWTHFSLLSFTPLEGGQLHLYGAFNNFQLDESTRMKYNPESGFFENARLFKQGYYDYNYVLLRKDGSLDPGFISGNFEKTENEYQVIVYFRDLGARYDRIIGRGSASSLNITN